MPAHNNAASGGVGSPVVGECAIVDQQTSSNAAEGPAAARFVVIEAGANNDRLVDIGGKDRAALIIFVSNAGSAVALESCVQNMQARTRVRANPDRAAAGIGVTGERCDAGPHQSRARVPRSSLVV